MELINKINNNIINVDLQHSLYIYAKEKELNSIFEFNLIRNITYEKRNTNKQLSKRISPDKKVLIGIRRINKNSKEYCIVLLKDSLYISYEEENYIPHLICEAIVIEHEPNNIYLIE